MLTIEKISQLFKVPKGTVSSWGSSKSSSNRPLLFNFLKVLSEDFVEEVLKRKKPQNALSKEHLYILLGSKKSFDNLDLICKFISLLEKREIEEILKRVYVYEFLKKGKYNESIENILKKFNINKMLTNCYLDNLHINKNFYYKVLNYVEKIKEKDIFAKIKASHIAKELDLNPITVSKYLEIIDIYENIPISSKNLIKKAIEVLKKENKKPTIENIMKITKLGYGTVQHNLKNIKKNI